MAGGENRGWGAPATVLTIINMVIMGVSFFFFFSNTTRDEIAKVRARLDLAEYRIVRLEAGK